MRILATSSPSHGTQGFLYVIAVVLFLIGAVIAWFTPLTARAIACIAAGLTVVALVFAWIQLAAT